jgi:hypothetical protein
MYAPDTRLHCICSPVVDILLAVSDSYRRETIGMQKYLVRNHLDDDMITGIQGYLDMLHHCRQSPATVLRKLRMLSSRLEMIWNFVSESESFSPEDRQNLRFRIEQIEEAIEAECIPLRPMMPRSNVAKTVSYGAIPFSGIVEVLKVAAPSMQIIIGAMISTLQPPGVLRQIDEAMLDDTDVPDVLCLRFSRAGDSPGLSYLPRKLYAASREVFDSRPTLPLWYNLTTMSMFSIPDISHGIRQVAQLIPDGPSLTPRIIRSSAAQWYLDQGIPITEVRSYMAGGAVDAIKPLIARLPWLEHVHVR